MLIKNGNYLLNIVQFPRMRSAQRYCDEKELKPKYPELLDVLFTQYCDYGCDFCYLGCTPNGAHADLDFAEKALESVPDWVEINCAGGNIIRHPQWKEIPKRFARFKSLNTTVNPKVFDEVNYTEFEGFTAVGVSINDDAVFAHYEHPIQALRNYCYVAIQIIPEMIGVEETEKILRRCKQWKLPVLFLGYKFVGRGKGGKVRPFEDKELKALIKNVEEQELTLSVDTSFVKNYKTRLGQLLTEDLGNIQEGKFSFYVDLVHQYCAQSSWSMGKKFELSDVKTMFNNIRGVPCEY